MAVLKADQDKYYAFVEAQMQKLKCFAVEADQLLWHYTTGEGLIGIIESGTLFSTQVSCLNDSTEIRYGSNLLRDAILDLIREEGAEIGAEEREINLVFDRYSLASREDPIVPSNAKGFWFVTCFSTKGDDLSQWRAYSGGENGYAIGFRAPGLIVPGTLLVRVNYDGAQHRAVAAQLARATFQFIREGLADKDAESHEQWTKEFLEEWRMWVDHLSPMIKD